MAIAHIEPQPTDKSPPGSDEPMRMYPMARDDLGPAFQPRRRGFARNQRLCAVAAAGQPGRSASAGFGCGRLRNLHFLSRPERSGGLPLKQPMRQAPRKSDNRQSSSSGSRVRLFLIPTPSDACVLCALGGVSWAQGGLVENAVGRSFAAATESAPSSARSLAGARCGLLSDRLMA
jgi:hypothetical protein